MNRGPSREELRQRLLSLRKAVVAGSVIAFLATLGLVATNPVGTQAATGDQSNGGDQAQSNDPQPAQPPDGGSGGYSNPMTNVPPYQPPVLHSRRS